jgi:hypothetical protein
MKIDNTLRLTIIAASKAQAPIPYNQRDKELAVEVKKVLNAHPTIKKTSQQKLTKVAALRQQLQNLNDEVNGLLAPLGLRIKEGGIGTDFSAWDDEDASHKKFVKAGGIVPPEREKWRAEKVIAELAAADAKDAPAILAKYGIVWK